MLLTKYNWQQQDLENSIVLLLDQNVREDGSENGCYHVHTF